MNMKLLGAAAIVAAAAIAGSVSAAPLNGTFGLQIYNFNAGNVEANAAATVANVDANSGKRVYGTSSLGSWTGDLDFRINSASGAPSIMDFLNTSSGGLGIALTQDLSTKTLSTGSGSGSAVFGTTTLFDFTGFIDGPVDMTIIHDDGITMLDDFGTILSVGSPDPSLPTTETTTSFRFGGGAFRLIYAAANGDPSILEVNVAAIPLPATLFLMLGALGGLGAMSRRRRAAV